MCYKTAYHPGWDTKFHKHHKNHKNHGRGHWKSRFSHAWNYPPVNVEELDDRYEILLYAAGYSKTDFQVSVKDDTLIIKVEKPEHGNVEGFNWRRMEFTPGSFKRQFELNEKIDKDSISAAYEDGILKVTLPKQSGFETVRQEITIA